MAGRRPPGSTDRPTAMRSPGSPTGCSRPQGPPGRPRLAGPGARRGRVADRPLGRGNCGRESRCEGCDRRRVRRGGRRPRDRGRVLDRGDRRGVREHGRPAADGPLHVGHDRRDRPDGSLRRQRPRDVRRPSAVSMAASPGERAARKARDGERRRATWNRAATRSSSSRRPSPTCFEFLCIYGFNGRPVEEGRSFVAARRSAVRLVDHAARRRDRPGDGRAPVRRRRDAEAAGRPRRRRRDTAVLHSRRTRGEGRRLESTGHAVEGGDRWGALPTSLVLEAGRPRTRT